MAVWLRRLVGSSELVSRRQGSKSRRKLTFFPSFFLQLFKLQPPKIVFFFFTFSVFSSLILRKKSNYRVLCISANLWKNRTIDRVAMWLGKDPWFHFHTGIPPTFSFLYQGRLAVNRKSRRFWKQVEKNEIRTGESCLGLGGKGRWRKVFTNNSHTWDCLFDASQNIVRTSSDLIWEKFDRSSTCVYFSFQSQFPISASWVVEEKMTCGNKLFSRWQS